MSDSAHVLFQTNEAGIWVLTASTWMTSRIWTPKSLPCIFPKSKIYFHSSDHFLLVSVGLVLSLHLFEKRVSKGCGRLRVYCEKRPVTTSGLPPEARVWPCLRMVASHL